jgi:uncharacterized protein
MAAPTVQLPSVLPKAGSGISTLSPPRAPRNLGGMTDLASFGFIALTFVLAGFVKGVIGLGLPTVAVGLLGLVMAPAEAAALLVVPSLVTNLWQLFAGPRFGALLRRLWPMLVAICLGTWAGAGLLTGGSAGHATAALGAALVLYALVGLGRLQLRVSPRWERRLSPLIGAATGLVTAATGVFVLPAVPFLQALGLDKEDLIQALGLSFTVSTIALAVGLAHDGAFGGGTLGHSALAIVPALAGMGIGQWIRLRVRPALFRRCFFLGLLVLGADLLIRGL